MTEPRDRGASASGMLSGLTHELRTPLNSILMLSELLEESLEEPAREARYARQIHQAAEDLLELVSQAGELGRLEAGRLAVEARETATADLTRRIAEAAGEAAGGAALPAGSAKPEVPPLVVERAPGAPERVVTDPAKLLRAIELVIAAARHASGGATVAVLLEGPSGGGLAIRVADAGPTLVEGERESLFVPFGGAGPRTARRFGGTGLGLPVAHALATLLGGTLTAEPGSGEEGCVLVLRIPHSRESIQQG